MLLLKLISFSVAEILWVNIFKVNFFLLRFYCSSPPLSLLTPGICCFSWLGWITRLRLWRSCTGYKLITLLAKPKFEINHSLHYMKQKPQTWKNNNKKRQYKQNCSKFIIKFSRNSFLVLFVWSALKAIQWLEISFNFSVTECEKLKRK